MLHLAGKASIRRRPVNSALGRTTPPSGLAMRTHVLLLAVGLLLVGCASEEGRFIVNNTRVRADPSRLASVRSSWSPPSGQVAMATKASQEDRQWTLDFIANIEASGVSPCTSLDLTLIRQRDLAPIRGKRPTGEVLEFRPKSFSEVWIVTACGTVRHWQVFDETSDPSNPHRVILGQRS